MISLKFLLVLTLFSHHCLQINSFHSFNQKLKRINHENRIFSNKKNYFVNFSKIQTNFLKFLITSSIFLSFNPFQYVSSMDIPSSNEISTKSIRGYQTRDGLVYFDIKAPNINEETPKYGEFISFYYSLYYLEAPDKELVLIDSNFGSNEPYLQKHVSYHMI